MRLHLVRRNIAPTAACLLGLLVSNSSTADIDAQCERVTGLFDQQINAEELVHQDVAGQKRIKEIALSLCTETEKRVQEQHIEGKEKALENWFFESHPEKAGNRRLKTKR